MDSSSRRAQVLGAAPVDPAGLAQQLADLAAELTGTSARLELLGVDGNIRWAGSSQHGGGRASADDGGRELTWHLDGLRRARLLLGAVPGVDEDGLDWEAPGLACWRAALLQGLRGIDLDDAAWQAAELDDLGSLVHGMALSEAGEADIAGLLADRALVALRASVAIVGLYAYAAPGAGARAFSDWAVAGRPITEPSAQLVDATKLAQMTAAGTAVRGRGALPAADLAGGSRGPWLLAPLQSMGGSLGIVLVGREHGAADFSRLESERLLTTGGRAAFAVRYLRARESEEDAVVAHERHRIARDLHDLTIQRMFGVGMLLETSLRVGDGSAVPADRVAAAIESINEGIAELRLVIAGYDGDPPPADSEAVAAAVAREVALQRSRFPVAPTVDVQLPPTFQLARARLRGLTAAVREGLSNAGRHCDCREVSVRVRAKGGRLRLTLDSRGELIPAPASTRTRGSGRGIVNLQRRAQQLGGDCLVNLGEGGATLTWWIPVALSEPAVPAG